MPAQPTDSTPPRRARPRSRPQKTVRRRGVTAVLAMLYLVIFSALALGFYAQTNLSTQISGGERKQAEAQLAAESGLQFIRYQLSCVNIPPSLSASAGFKELSLQLADRLNGSANMGTKVVGYTAAVPGTGGAPDTPAVIRVPDTGAIRLVSKGPTFQAVITDASPRLTVKIVGSSGQFARALQIQFQRAPKPYALIGLNSLTMSGSAFSDSYNAAKGDPAVEGRYQSSKAAAGGSVGSNGNVTLSNTAKVNGDVRYGMGATATVAPGAAVTGMLAPLYSPAAYESVVLPPAGTYTDLGDVNMNAGTVSKGAGTYVINNLNLSGTAKINWTGAVKLYIKSSYVVTGSVVITTFDNLPVNRQIFFLPSCATATWDGTNKSVGELYAPDTAFTIGGSVEMMGRIVAKSITNSSSGGMHYDESLPAPIGVGSYAPVRDTYLEVLP
jgi:hypothetical protein